MNTTDIITESSASVVTTEEPTKVLLASPFVFNIIAFIQTCLSIFGFVGNGLAILIFLKHKQLRSPTNTFIMNLIFCDMAMGMIAFIAAAAAFNHGWVFGDSMCVFEGFMVYFLGLTSMYLLAAISLDRYVVIAKPLSASKITQRVAAFCTGMCWVVGFLWASFPLLGWNEYTVEGIGISCSVIWRSNKPSYTTYIMAIFFVCLVLPVCLMVFSYYNVYMTVKNVTRNNVWDLNSRVARRNLRVEKKMLKTCVAMVSIFVLSWLPYATVSFVSAFGDPSLVTPLMATIPSLVAKSSGIWNPVIYVGTNKQFRIAFYAIIPCQGIKDSLTKKEEEKPESDQDEDETKQDQKKGKAGTAGGRGGGIAVAPAKGEDGGVGEVTVITQIDNGVADPETIELKDQKKGKAGTAGGRGGGIAVAPAKGEDGGVGEVTVITQIDNGVADPETIELKVDKTDN